MHILCNYVHKDFLQMQKQYIISIVLDKRRIKTNGTYPVRLRVFMPETRKQKLYSTIFNFTEVDFKNIWETAKPKGEFKENKIKLSALEAKAEMAAQNLTTFTFEDFERLMFGNSGAKRNVTFYFEKIIKEYTDKGSISTAKGYNDALTVLRDFQKMII